MQSHTKKHKYLDNKEKLMSGHPIPANDEPGFTVRSLRETEVASEMLA